MPNKGTLTIIYRERDNFFKVCEYKLDFKNDNSTLNSMTSQSSILDIENGGNQEDHWQLYQIS